MPTYVYNCKACDHTFERFESMTAKPDKSCPKCKKKKAERNISGGAGFLFKGAGFYTTDYRSSSYKESAKKDTTAAPAPSGDPKAAGACKTESAPKTESTPKPASTAKKKAS
ncbi:MAG: zinc ribbon domain-containing protein [Planctomycetes bacterium]|nr:zinc ribbon domain-containing protein [Planctomycetota bacterium]